MDDDHLSACESLIDFHAIAEIAAHSDRLRNDPAVIKDKNDVLSVTLLNRGLGNRDPRTFGVCAGLRPLQKRHLRVHIGKYARINFFKAHFDFHRSLLAVRGRNYLANLGRQLLTRQRVEGDFGLKPRCNLADAGFIDVSFDFERVWIDNRNYRPASRGAAVNRGGYRFTDLRVFRNHQTLERAADIHVFELRFYQSNASLRRVDLGSRR